MAITQGRDATPLAPSSKDTAWGLSKSAWSYREFAPFVAEAMK